MDGPSTAYAVTVNLILHIACRDLKARRLYSTVHSACKLISAQVEGLAGSRVLHVACGVWHTAAVAAHVPELESLRQGSRDVDPAEWDAIQQKMTDAYDVLDEVRALRSSPVACPARLGSLSMDDVIVVISSVECNLSLSFSASAWAH